MKHFFNPNLRVLPWLAAGGLCFGALASQAQSYAAAGRGGSLLPAGYLSTKGSQINDDRGTPVRIASISWYGTA